MLLAERTSGQALAERPGRRPHRASGHFCRALEPLQEAYTSRRTANVQQMVALKEWAVTCAALGDGSQTVRPWTWSGICRAPHDLQHDISRHHCTLLETHEAHRQMWSPKSGFGPWLETLKHAATSAPAQLANGKKDLCSLPDRHLNAFRLHNQHHSCIMELGRLLDWISFAAVVLDACCKPCL